MKYAKKMKLIDIDDDGATPYQSNNLYQTMQSDKKFMEPRTLSMLDNSMNDILNRGDMADGEKWILYNQTLHRFLNYMKNARSPITIEKTSSQAMQNTTPQFDRRNQTINAFDGHISDNSLNGIFPMRDSIESISQPNVRDFFQQIRNIPANTSVNQSSPVAAISDQPITHSVSPMDHDFEELPLSPQIQQPPKRKTLTRKKSPERRATKRLANPNISGVPPRKVAQKTAMTPRELFRVRKPTRSYNEVYWEKTNAK